MKKLRILVACGGGIATSSWAAAEIALICESVGVSADIFKDRVLNVSIIAKDYDVCFVTARYNEDVGCPVYQVNGLITGINEEVIRNKIRDVVIELSKD